MYIKEAFEQFRKMKSGLPGMIEDELRRVRIEELVKDQLYSGIDGKGNALRPTYTEDPYWRTVTKTDKAAKRRGEQYRDFKAKITPPQGSFLGFSPRNTNTPNLIIRGDFYDSIKSDVRNWGVKIYSEGFYASGDIERKYGKEIFGLTRIAKGYIVRNHLAPALYKYFKDYGL
ncbi:MAG: ABC transporter [Bacteroidales bacterium]|nr:ABC transporter [Bacteroidales bacterium]